MSERDRKHQETFRKKIEAAWRRQRSVHLPAVLGGYCDNSLCEVRQVLVHQTFQSDPTGRVGCPGCGEQLKPENHVEGVLVETKHEYMERREREALWTVAARVLRERRPGEGATPLGVITDEYFRSREVGDLKALRVLFDEEIAR